jgi:hypothetical protein
MSFLRLHNTRHQRAEQSARKGRKNLQLEQLDDKIHDLDAVPVLDDTHTVPLLSVLVDRAEITGGEDVDLELVGTKKRMD